MAKANWFPSPAPKVFSEIAAPTFEEQRFNYHDAERAKRLADAIAILMRDISMDPVSCERRPAKENKNGKRCYAIGRITVLVGTHALGKDVAYNADDRAGPHAPH